MSKKYVQKILNFGACSIDTEPDRQPRPAASALELKNTEDKNVAKQRSQKQSLKLSEFGKLYERMQLGR